MFAERFGFTLCGIAFVHGTLVACAGSVAGPNSDKNAGGTGTQLTGGTSERDGNVGGSLSAGRGAGGASSPGPGTGGSPYGASTNTSVVVTGTHIATSSMCSCGTASQSMICTGTGLDTSTLAQSGCTTSTPTGTGYGFTFNCQWNSCGSPCSTFQCTSGVAVSTATGTSTHTATSTMRSSSPGPTSSAYGTAIDWRVSTGTSTAVGSTP